MELTFPTCGNPSSPRLQSEQNQEVEDKELSKDCSLTSSQRMSNKSLYRSVGFGNTQAITDGWVKVEFWIVEDQKVEIEFAVVEEKSRPFFAMEKEREDQFFNRNEHALHEINKKLKNNNDRISESDSEDEFDDIPLYNDDDDVEEKRSAGSSRRPHGWESKASKFLKSVSMTTLVLSGNLEPTNAGVENDVVGQAESYEVPYIDGAKGYGAAEMPSPADFGFCSAQHYAENYPWSASTPKLRRNLNKKIKTKWQPVSRFVSRCYQWDSCSSVDSSSRWFSFSPRRIIKRAICCGSTVSSDDGKSTNSFSLFVYCMFVFYLETGR